MINQGAKYIGSESASPVGKANGYMSVVDGTLYYFAGGNRYKIIATLDNPALSFLILEDGSYFLQEDGSSKIALEA